MIHFSVWRRNCSKRARLIGRTTARDKRLRRLSGIELLEARLPLSITLLNDDFQVDAVGTLPESADQFWNASGPDTFIQVAGAGGTYVPPFGGAGNKSLVIHDAGIVQPIVSWRSIFSDDPTEFQNGSIEFDLYLPPASGTQDWTFIDFRLGYGGPDRTAPTTVNDTTVWNSFRINPGAPLGFAFDHNTNTLLASLSASTVLHIRYDLNGAARTYRLTINGNLVNAGGIVDRPWRTGATGVNMLGFFGAHPADSAPVYIDNLVVVNDDIESTPVGSTARTSRRTIWNGTNTVAISVSQAKRRFLKISLPVHRYCGPTSSDRARAG